MRFPVFFQSKPVLGIWWIEAWSQLPHGTHMKTAGIAGHSEGIGLGSHPQHQNRGDRHCHWMLEASTLWLTRTARKMSSQWLMKETKKCIEMPKMFFSGLLQVRESLNLLNPARGCRSVIPALAIDRWTHPCWDSLLCHVVTMKAEGWKHGLLWVTTSPGSQAPKSRRT